MTFKTFACACALAGAAFSAAAEPIAYSDLLAKTMGERLAVRTAARLAAETPAQKAARAAGAERLRRASDAARALGAHAFKGGFVPIPPPDFQDDENLSVAFIDGYCEIHASAYGGRFEPYEAARPGLPMLETLFLHEAAHCQQAAAVPAAFGSGLERALSEAVLAEPASKPARWVEEAFADAHALLVLRAWRPADFPAASNALAEKRLGEVDAAGGFSERTVPDEHQAFHSTAALALAPPSSGRGAFGPAAFEAAVRALPLAASRLPWLRAELEAFLDPRRAAAAAAAAAVANRLAFSGKAPEKYRSPRAQGGALGAAAAKEAERFVRPGASDAELDLACAAVAAAVEPLARSLFSGAARLLSESEGSSRAAALALEARFKPAQAAADEAWRLGQRAHKARPVPAKTPSLEGAAPILLPLRIPFG